MKTYYEVRYFDRVIDSKTTTSFIDIKKAVIFLDWVRGHPGYGELYRITEELIE